MQVNESILRCVNQAEIREKVLSHLTAQGIPTHTPCLKLEVNNSEGKIFSLKQEDVHSLFSKFGTVRSIRVINSVVLVLFKDITSAYFAHKLLDGRAVSPGVELSLSWYLNQEDRQPMKELQPEPQPVPSSVKYTCRFDIQIENDKEFQVARRLIGVKGCNMKKIVEACCHGISGKAHNIVKIRLRGRGSGFREGPRKAESDEPLHLCVSSKYEDKYKIAVHEIEALIGNVYREYSDFCRRKRWRDPQLSIKKHENLTGRPTEKECGAEDMLDMRCEGRRQNSWENSEKIRDLLKDRGILLGEEPNQYMWQNPVQFR